MGALLYFGGNFSLTRLVLILLAVLRPQNSRTLGRAIIYGAFASHRIFFGILIYLLSSPDHIRRARLPENVIAYLSSTSRAVDRRTIMAFLILPGPFLLWHWIVGNGRRIVCGDWADRHLLSGRHSSHRSRAVSFPSAGFLC